MERSAPKGLLSEKYRVKVKKVSGGHLRLHCVSSQVFNPAFDGLYKFLFVPKPGTQNGVLGNNARSKRDFEGNFWNALTLLAYSINEVVAP